MNGLFYILGLALVVIAVLRFFDLPG